MKNSRFMSLLESSSKWYPPFSSYKKGKVAFENIKRIDLKSTKCSESNEEKYKYVASDDISSLNKEEITLLAKTFTKFFHSEMNYFGRIRRESFSRRNTSQGKKAEKFDDKGTKYQSRRQLDHIKCYKCSKPKHITAQCYSKQNYSGKTIMKVYIIFRIVAIIIMRIEAT